MMDIRPRGYAATPAELATWRGLDRRRGELVDGWGHIGQSVLDILGTRLGTRVMRPEYGSGVFDLLDRPVNATWLADLYLEVAVALARWEPRIALSRIRAALPAPGRVELDLTLRLIGSGEVRTVAVGLGAQ